jgi:cell migration-inducing and hyaluronan-binding protein
LWYLFINSAITDVQNGGITFVTGGGYTQSDVINGHGR